MTEAAIVLFMLVAVAISRLAGRFVPAVPSPLVQIALGALIDAVTPFSATLDPQLFFLLLVPPLLFVDGWRLPRFILVRQGGIIVGLALGLVFTTVLGVGLFLTWLVPALPTGVAFALAAVLAPTDPVANAAIGRRVRLPPTMLHVLEAESLLNDASALVCLKLAVGAVVTGVFHAGAVIPTFAGVAIGGAAIGAVTTWTIVRIDGYISCRLADDEAGDILLTLLVPFVAFILAEAVHASGVLAAAVAGLSMAFEKADVVTLGTQMRRTALWDMIRATLNGIVFVLLGLQLPVLATRAIAAVSQTGSNPVQDALCVAGWTVAVLVVLLATRFLWNRAALEGALRRAGRRGRLTGPMPGNRLSAIITIAGARGAITLAAVLTLPMTTASGAPFPARDLAIGIAAGVILLSLLTTTLALPPLLAGLTPISDGRAALTGEDEVLRSIATRMLIFARDRDADAAEAGDDAQQAAAKRLVAQWRDREAWLELAGKQTSGFERLAAAEWALALEAADHERVVMRGLVDEGKIDPGLMARLSGDLDLRIIRLLNAASPDA